MAPAVDSAAMAFFGYALIGLGPGIVFFCFFIASKSFVVLLAVFSAFYWLVVMLVTSSLFRGFLPIDPTIDSYAGVLCAAVFIEEVARYGVWLMHRATTIKLTAISRSTGHAFTHLDRLYLALGWGYGQGVVHVLFFFGSILPLTAGHGTLYSAQCPGMSIFLVSALSALGFGAMLTATMVISLDGWATGNWVHIAMGPALHLATALSTLPSLSYNGCIATVPAVLALGAASSAYAGRLAWRKGGSWQPTTPTQHLRAA